VATPETDFVNKRGGYGRLCLAAAIAGATIDAPAMIEHLAGECERLRERNRELEKALASKENVPHD